MESRDMLTCLLAVSLQYCVFPVCPQQVLPHRQFTAQVSHCVPSAPSMLLIKRGTVSFPCQMCGARTGSLLPSKSTLPLSVLFSLVASYVFSCGWAYVWLWDAVSKWATYDLCGRWHFGCFSWAPSQWSAPSMTDCVLLPAHLAAT